jgi:MoxR-like ATPase
MEKVIIDGIEIFLTQPDQIPVEWVGQDDLVTQVLAAWFVIGDDDLPLNPRLLGKPGVGKTTLAYHAGRTLNKPVYLFQATMDTRPEDLIITPVVSEAGKIRYMASPVVSAMIKGGVAVIDEGNRMSEKSWASLAPLMDNRRYVESIVAGIKIKAHPDFRLCTTMNDDASTFELPDYIHTRLQPQIFIDFPDRDEELLILKTNLPFADEEVLEYVVDFLQASHDANERYSVRDGINIARYALKRLYGSGERMKSSQRKVKILEYMKESATMILDKIAAEYFHEVMEDDYEE